jgi:putative heme-binding domain-containing protein
MFFNEPLNCQRCHSIRGEGNHVGPDLSNLVFRDYASVLRDIQQPSATLNPDFLAYNIQTKEGEDLTGVLQTETPEKITVIDGNAHTTSISKSQIASIKPSAISFMPEGLLQTVKPSQLKDLMTFLLTMPLEPAQGGCSRFLLRKSRMERSAGKGVGIISRSRQRCRFCSSRLGWT